MANETQPSGEDDIQRHLADRDFRAAFEVLLGRFKDRVFRLAWSMLRDETRAEDMTQDVFIKVWRALPGYRGGASLSTWIYTITRNTCLTELKKCASRPTVSLYAPEFAESLDALPAMQTSDPESGAGMDAHAMLAALPENYRRVVTLFYLEQRRYEDIADMLGLPIGTVKTFLFRARKELLRLATRPPTPACHTACHT